MYENAKYFKSSMTGEVSMICIEINGIASFVPLDPANTDYQNIMKLVEDGELIIAEPENTE